ncbi:MAG: 16S rRNA (cytidine(1402)-2'-O)-methyltransferase [Dictyoglomus thermophilum]|nr:16S rRNA (cytidine(1402)-2'-O)-methyltransferase [Dictyoglomus thermophilum]
MGKLYVVATPIGNLKDITIRAIDVLKMCPVIAAEDTRHTLILLKAYNIEDKILISYHKYNEEKRTELFLDFLLNKNMDVALVSDAGTPCISDPGYKIVRAAREKNIEVVSIPGPSSLTASLSISGLPTNEFLFIGFLPKEENKKLEKLLEIKKSNIKTFVIYESPKRIIKSLNTIKEVFPNSTICVCRELTKKFERTYYGDIEKVLLEISNDPYKEKGEYTVIVFWQNNLEYEETLSIEALLIDQVVKHKISLKEAVNIVAKMYNIPKKEIYKKSIELKNKFKEEEF